MRELRRAARLHAQTCARRVNVAASRAQLASDNEHSKVNTTTKGSSARARARQAARKQHGKSRQVCVPERGSRSPKSLIVVCSWERERERESWDCRSESILRENSRIRSARRASRTGPEFAAAS